MFYALSFFCVEVRETEVGICRPTAYKCRLNELNEFWGRLIISFVFGPT